MIFEEKTIILKDGRTAILKSPCVEDAEKLLNYIKKSCKGVYFDEDYANGRIEELRDMKITDIGVYYESKCEQDIKITIMEFVDDYDHLTFSPPELIREGCVTVG